MEPVSYDALNGELRTVRRFFVEKAEAVLMIRWKLGIKKGAVIAPGDLLATIVWDESPDEPILAPAECAGEVDRTNRRIPYERIRRRTIPLLWMKG